ncbi:MAG: DJ-1/PfpI family protein, partial [Deltaproteobacteria bacterium]|nr:DJ-1/PfpI family protein [Deltaproteobacteria bacterium]
MFGKKSLRGMRIAALTADGVEQVELTVPVRALRKAGATVDVVALRPGRLLAMNHHEPGSRFRVDVPISEADPAAYDGLFLPGGLLGPDALRQSQDARRFVQGMDAAGKPIAAICHGAWLLSSAGLAGGRV